MSILRIHSFPGDVAFLGLPTRCGLWEVVFSQGTLGNRATDPGNRGGGGQGAGGGGQGGGGGGGGEGSGGVLVAEEAGPDRDHDRLGPVGGTELLVDLRDVRLGGR